MTAASGQGAFCLGAEPTVAEAQLLLEELAGVFLRSTDSGRQPQNGQTRLLNVDARYRTLVEQIPAVLFMVNLDGGAGEAYVSPYIEAALGFSQAEWLEDPIRWYRQIHPDDNLRWNVEAAEMFLTGKPLRSVYRVMARDGHVVWFHCEAKVVRKDDGEPWFIQGVAFDITDLKQAEEALQEERNFVSTILDTVDTLVMVLDPAGRIVRFNRAFEKAAGQFLHASQDRYASELFVKPQDLARFRSAFAHLLAGSRPSPFESHGMAGETVARLVSWSGTALRDGHGKGRHAIFTGVDITESKRLERAILDISAREQRHIGQDLHDGLGQHLTGIAFMSKALEHRLADRSLPESSDAAKIVNMVNQAIHRTRELSRGLLPVVSDARGLMSALEQWSSEVQDLFGVSCRFHCDRPVLVYDNDAAMHLYHIAQEAVNNALKHGRPKHIVITLSEAGGAAALSILDDGTGIPEDVGQSRGMGMHIMNYRAKMVGGTLEVDRARAGGTEIICRFRAGGA